MKRLYSEDPLEERSYREIAHANRFIKHYINLRNLSTRLIAGLKSPLALRKPKGRE